MGDADEIDIAAAGVRARVSMLGAELRALHDGAGRDLLWDGDPAWWTGRAPILFPVIGLLASGGYTLGGQRYEMPKHGFARRSRFTVVERSAGSVTMRLEDSAATREVYPFAFALDIGFACGEDGLRVSAAVRNRSGEPMPASFGFHPAFRWPLPGGGARTDYRVTFAAAEPAPIRRIGPDGLLPDGLASPIQGRELVLRDELFVDDAIILDRVASRSLVFGSPGRAAVRVGWENLPVLALWTKPGAPFLCVEPWAGLPDPAGWTGDFALKPGGFVVPPGAVWRCAMTIAPEPPAA